MPGEQKQGRPKWGPVNEAPDGLPYERCEVTGGPPAHQLVGSITLEVSEQMDIL